MKTIFFLATLFSFTAWGESIAVLSPDYLNLAEINVMDNSEIAVKIFNANGHPLTEINLQSQSHKSGAKIEKYAWSENSQWFVFSTTTSGRATAVHRTYFYSRKSECIRSVDDRVGSEVFDANFKLDNDQLTVRIQPDPGSRGDSVGATFESVASLPYLDSFRDRD